MTSPPTGRQGCFPQGAAGKGGEAEQRAQGQSQQIQQHQHRGGEGTGGAGQEEEHQDLLIGGEDQPGAAGQRDSRRRPGSCQDS